MILAFHLTWTTYGHWFPNDPRGSWSDEVWKPGLREVRELDEERKVTRPRLTARRELQTFLDQARSRLTFPVVGLNDEEINCVGEAFDACVRAGELDVRACAILRNHVHIVVMRHVDAYERIVNRLKGVSSQAVRRHRGYELSAGRNERIPIWTQGYWCRYVSSEHQIQSVIAYVEQNPIREGMAEQNWAFVTG